MTAQGIRIFCRGHPGGPGIFKIPLNTSQTAYELVSVPATLVQTLLLSKDGHAILCYVAVSAAAGEKCVLTKDETSNLVSSFCMEYTFPDIVVDEIVSGRGQFGWPSPAERLQVDDVPTFNQQPLEILINATRVRNMVNTSNNAGDKEELELYQFQLYSTFLRAIGAIFGLYLAHAIQLRNPSMQVVKFNFEKVGRSLEKEVFGGQINWYKGESEREEQPGVPYRIHEDDGKLMTVWKFERKYIQELLRNELKLPLRVLVKESSQTGLVPL